MKFIRSHIKKLYLWMSLCLIVAWLASVFILGLTGFVHILFWLGAILFIRSLMQVEAGSPLQGQ